MSMGMTTSKHPAKSINKNENGNAAGRSGLQRRTTREEYDVTLCLHKGEKKTQMHGETWLKQIEKLVRGCTSLCREIIKTGFVRRYLGEPAFP